MRSALSSSQRAIRRRTFARPCVPSAAHAGLGGATPCGELAQLCRAEVGNDPQRLTRRGVLEFFFFFFFFF